MQTNTNAWQLQFSLTGLFVAVTWFCLTVCTLATTDFSLGRFLAGAIFVLSNIVAVILIAVSPRLRKPAIVFVVVGCGHLMIALWGREVYPIGEIGYQLVNWLELPNTDRGLGDYVLKGILALSMFVGLTAGWITSVLARDAGET